MMENYPLEAELLAQIKSDHFVLLPLGSICPTAELSTGT